MPDVPDDPSAVDDHLEPDANADAETAPASKAGRLLGRLKRSPVATRFLEKLRSLDKRERLMLGGSVGGLLLAAIIVPITLFGGAHTPKPVVVSLGGPLVQHEFPMFLADLIPARRRSAHVKLKMIVEIEAEALPRLTDKENAVTASVIAHLRDKKREDLYGKDGINQLRGELLAVINEEIAPARASSILFTEFLVD